MLRGFDPGSLTAEYNQNALREVNPIKIKMSSKMKGRMCANGEPHRKFVPREEVKSLKITMEGLLATMVIDEYEDRKVATFNVPGAYL